MTVYDFEALANDGKNRQLSDFAGQVLLIVNTASACGYTPQYEGLNKLYLNHKDRGFSILAFPCNQFGWQEQGDAGKIMDFCKTKYDVQFPIFAKIDVNGKNAHPLFNHLSHERPGLFGTALIKWNFTKFLVDREGHVTKRYPSMTTPHQIEKDIEALLKS